MPSQGCLGRSTSWRGAVAVLIALVLGLTGTLAGARADASPARPKAARTVPGPALTVPKAKLAGALRCPAGRAHPSRPVVLLVHGTGTTGEDSWPDGLGAVLDRAGSDWCMVTIPGRELDDIQETSGYVVAAVRRLHRRGGGRDVSLVGHSQGADLIRWPVRWWPDVRAAVDDLITIEGANQGVPTASAVCAKGACAPAVWQYRLGSQFMEALNRVPAPAGPSHTAIGSLTDERLQPGLPTPTSTARIPSTAAANVLVQDLCPGRVVTHVQAIFDAAELAIVLDALAHRGRADLGRTGTAACSRVYAPGIDPVAATGAIAAVYAGAAGPTLAGPSTTARAEPPLRAYARAR
jgi:hypothetical protein